MSNYIRIKVVDGNWEGLMDIPEWTYLATKKHRTYQYDVGVYELDFLKALADFDGIIEDILKSKGWL